MSGLCRDCKWWTPANAQATPPGDLWGLCTFVEIESSVVLHPQSKARAWGMSDDVALDAGLETQAEFGCVEFTATETP